jgi:hypothetical protein
MSWSASAIAQMPVVLVTDMILQHTARLLSSFAIDFGSEGVVYWFGLELGKRAIVTTLVVPAADTSMGAVRTSAAANAEAVGVIAGTPLVLLGQAHSHPGEWVDHSATDDRDTFAQFPGAISVVVPFSGEKGMSLSECGVHRHIKGKYRRISDADLSRHLSVLPGLRDLR